MNKLPILILCLFIAGTGCSKKKSDAPAADAPLLKLRSLLAEGDYNDTIKMAKDIASQVPPGNDTEEALYLQAYAQVYGKADFSGARRPLKQLLDFYPKGRFASDAQKLLADCEYWQGHYHNAEREYKKLLANFGDRGLAGYAQLKEGHCLLLDDKVGDALNAYRDVVEKYPTEPCATSAQLMIANSYLKLQNIKQAKSELRKLMSLTQDGDIQQSAQKALRQIEEEEPFKKGVGDAE